MSDPVLANDAAARERIRTSLDESLLVEAAAGTGKTTVLIERLVAMLAAGRTTIERVVAVTFTRKAAGELKLRLRQELERARIARHELEPDAAARLVDAVARLEEAQIGTIHSFCAELLRERPVEAEVDPLFTELDDDEAARVLDRAFDDWLEQRLEAPPPGLRRAIEREALRRSFDDSTPLDRLRQAAERLVDWRDFDAPWRRDPAFEASREDQLGRLLGDLRRLDALRRRGNPTDSLTRALEALGDVLSWVDAHDESAPDNDALEARLVQLLGQLRREARWTGRTVDFAEGLPRQQVIDARDGLLDDLAAFADAADADLAALLHAELQGVLDGYERAKRAAGRLDYLDLLVRARDLLRHRVDVRAFLQQRFDLLFVDEFQDTDPLQAEILLLLAADDPAQDDWRAVRPAPGKLFLVGDPKQSIYRFRRADVLLYQDLTHQLEAAGVAHVVLARSFRALAPLQAAVNAAFHGQITEDARSGQPTYVPLAGGRTPATRRPSLVALPVPSPFGYRGRATKKAIEACLPDAIAAFVEWLVRESGWQVDDPEQPGKQVPLRPRHVCLLFRRMTSWGSDVTADYLRSFEARGVPHLLIGGRSFHQREEVETLRAALRAIEYPDDGIAVYAAMRGDLFGLTDAALFRYRMLAGHLEPLREHPNEPPDTLAHGDAPDARAADTVDDNDPARELAAVADALDRLATLHLERNERPIAETIQRLLEHCRAHAGFALRPAGPQVLANVQHVVDLARSFEMRGGISFRGFVERLDREASKPTAGQAPALEEGAEGVRLMTVHAAKGLEFPVVVLADLTCNLTGRDPDRFIDSARGLCAHKILGLLPLELREQAALERERDRAESVRLAYVAATRARDLLVVPGLGAGTWVDGWLSPLDTALKPAEPARSEPVVGAPPFGATTVLQPPHELPTGAPPIRPGLHRAAAGGHVVAWWDPATLRLGARSSVGVRHQRLIRPAERGDAADRGLERYEDWRDARAEALEAGVRPSHRVATVTETLAPPPDVEALEITVESTVEATRSAARPSGRRFGTLVHTLLRDVELGDHDTDEPADDSSIAALARLHGRMLRARPEEIDAATRAVAAALDHPLLHRAAAVAAVDPQNLRRELPLQLRLEDGSDLDGSLDLAFFDPDDTAADGTPGRWTVIDFKTGTADGDALDAYRRQLAWYVHALTRLDGRPARGVLLRV
ncbi:MAG: UvrD-helicase domain-containing protein [Acidobacteriota bacterium]